MESQPVEIVHWIMGTHQCPWRAIQPVVKARQQKPHRRASCQNGQCLNFRRCQRAILRIVGQQGPGFGDVETAIPLKTPGVQTDRQIIG